MRYIKPISDFEKLNRYLKNKFLLWKKDFSMRMKKENSETKHAVELLINSVRSKLIDSDGNKTRSKLTDLEKFKIKEQAGDIIKMLGIGSIFIAPGGSVVLGLLKIFKIYKHILPSSFKDDGLKE